MAPPALRPCVSQGLRLVNYCFGAPSDLERDIRSRRTPPMATPTQPARVAVILLDVKGTCKPKEIRMSNPVIVVHYHEERGSGATGVFFSAKLSTALRQSLQGISIDRHRRSRATDSGLAR